jgi:pimeloyl-ACP methyl ester carboxylesterase
MTLSYDEAGTGPAVVLIHSTVCDRRMWDPQIPALTAAGYRAIRCDLRGYGESPMPDGPHNNAQDVIDLLDGLGVDRAALVGSSGGGRVALEVAARWPDRVERLALLCTAVNGMEPGPDLSAFGDQEDALLEAGDVDGATDLNVRSWVGPEADDAVRDKVRMMQKNAFEVQLAATEEYEPIRVETDLAAITAPSLLVSGGHDFADFRAIAESLAGQLPQGRHVDLAWAGHLPNMERPDEINALLIAFLNGE